MFNFLQKPKIIAFVALYLISVFVIGNFAVARVDIQSELGAGFGLVTEDATAIIVGITNVALGFLGVLSLIFISYGGFILMISGGNQEKIVQAKKILISAVIGLVIILLSFAMVRFIVSTLGVADEAPAPTACIDTCASLGYECGIHTVCGEPTNCETCPGGQTCSNGKCVAGGVGCAEESVDVIKDGSFSQCGCSGTDGYVCDEDGDFVGDGLCLGSSCIVGQTVSASCNGPCSTTALNTRLCNTTSLGWACDNDYIQAGQTFFEQDGICVYQSVASPIATCVTSGSVCKNSLGTIYSGCNQCSDGDPCDVIFNEGNFNSIYGTCSGGICQQITAPASFDWRNYNGGNWMSPIRNQGNCGSCWAFATVGVAEAKWNIQEGNSNLDIDLSEQYIISDCCTIGTCAGGDQAFSCGITDEACYSYILNQTATSLSSCSGRCGDWSARLWDMSDYSFVTRPATDVYKKYLIMTKGPLYAVMGDANSLQWSLADESWICTNDDHILDTNHGVVLVGWDDVKGYWIMKNSWGLGFGDQGYHYIKYGECLLEPHYYLNSIVAP